MVEFGEVPAIIVTVFSADGPLAEMANATVHISSADLRLSGSYEKVGDVLYLSTEGDDKNGPAQETPEGHAVRLDEAGQMTHLTAVNAKWLIDRDGELTATLRDGRVLRIAAADLAGIVR